MQQIAAEEAASSSSYSPRSEASTWETGTPPSTWQEQAALQVNHIVLCSVTPQHDIWEKVAQHQTRVANSKDGGLHLCCSTTHSSSELQSHSAILFVHEFAYLECAIAMPRSTTVLLLEKLLRFQCRQTQAKLLIPPVRVGTGSVCPAYLQHYADDASAQRQEVAGAVSLCTINAFAQKKKSLTTLAIVCDTDRMLRSCNMLL